MKGGEGLRASQDGDIKLAKPFTMLFQLEYGGEHNGKISTVSGRDCESSRGTR